ncbi:MAG: DUF3102 domain-containing protein [Magnetococcales bacterium]|nr:DUF3102 domain-containing protein [Magnetococcales bacterium]
MPKDEALQGEVLTDVDNQELVQQYAHRIQGAINRSEDAAQAYVEAIVDAGRAINEAKEQLPHGSFDDLLDDQLSISRSKAFKYRKIALDHRLSNVSPGKHLPPNWTILYELTKLSDVQFDHAVAAGKINPEMRREQARRLLGIKDQKSLPAPTESKDKAKPALNPQSDEPEQPQPAATGYGVSLKLNDDDAQTLVTLLEEFNRPFMIPKGLQEQYPDAQELLKFVISGLREELARQG